MDRIGACFTLHPGLMLRQHPSSRRVQRRNSRKDVIAPVVDVGGVDAGTNAHLQPISRRRSGALKALGYGAIMPPHILLSDCSVEIAMLLDIAGTSIVFLEMFATTEWNESSLELVNDICSIKSLVLDHVSGRCKMCWKV